jgi:hypothetical protein
MCERNKCGSEYAPVLEPCEHANEISKYIKWKKFLDQVGNYQLPKKTLLLGAS